MEEGCGVPALSVVGDPEVVVIPGGMVGAIPGGGLHFRWA